MTDTELQIAVAECCGAKSFREEEYPHRTMWTFGEIGEGAECFCDCDLPSYTTSIDAIRDEVLKMDSDFQNQFSMKMAALFYKNKFNFYHQLEATDWCNCFIAAANKLKK